MTAELQIVLWGAAAALPVVLNLTTERAADAKGLSMMILLIWVMGRVFGALYTPPESMQWYPVVDSLAGITCFVAWRARPAPWKLGLVGCFLFQCALHAAFWLAWPTPGSLLRYVVANNIIFACELCLVGGPGVAHGARLVGRMLSGRARARRHAGA